MCTSKIIDFHMHLPWKLKDPREASQKLISAMNEAHIEKGVVIAIEPSESVFRRNVSTKSILKAASESLDLIAFSRCERVRKSIFNPEKTIKEHEEMIKIHKRTTEEVIDASRYSKGRLCPVASFNPDLGIEGNLERLRRIKDQILGLKLYPTFHFLRPDSDVMERLYNYLEDEGLILIVHTGCDPGIWELPALCENARPKYVERVARNHKDLIIILAHMGSYSVLQEGMFFHEALDLMSKYDNVYGDTSAISSYYIKAAVKEVGSDKVLFGSDYPYVVNFTPRDAVDIIKNLDISCKDKKAILYQNAHRLLKTLGGLKC